MVDESGRAIFRVLISEQLEDGIKFITAGEPTDIPGFRKLQNDIRNGHSVDILAEKFIDHIHSNLNTLANPQNLDFGELEGTFESAFGLLHEFYSEKTWEDPIGIHSKLDRFDLRPMTDMMKDIGSHMRRYYELEKLDRPELVLPVAKDLFVLSFEKMYRNTQDYLRTIFKEDGLEDPFVMMEELLCLKRTVPVKKNVNSDVRIIRNAFSHPEAIDKYYHYELKVGEDTETFDHKRLVHYNSMIAAKCSVVIGLSMIMRNLALYRCELKH